MKTLLLLVLSAFASSAMAGLSSGVTSRVPEPEMWALVGVAAAAFGASRWLRRRNGKSRK